MAIYTFSPFGYKGALVTVEIDSRRGIPAVDIAGLADGAVKESRERVKAAIRNSGFELPSERVIMALSPADLKKEGTGFDLPMALSVLSVTDDYPCSQSARVLVMGELELSGKLRPVRAVYPALVAAVAAGIKYAIVPKGVETAKPEGIHVEYVETLRDAYDALTRIDENEVYEDDVDEKPKYTSFIDDEDKMKDFPRMSKVDFLKFYSYLTEEEYDLTAKIIEEQKVKVEFNDIDYENNIDSVKGMDGLKYAMAVAVAGRHHLFAYGAPGCGKTLVLQHMPELMPQLTREESHSTTIIHSIAGLLAARSDMMKVRPFRMPHQTASIEGMCGGGANVRPGEISLAHNGVLFLDEAAEFRSAVLQMLRVPLENHNITICRAGRTTVYPANFQLVMAANPCPCGNYGSKDKVCLCSLKSIEQYWKKFSAPLLDRVEIKIDCNNPYETDFDYTLEELRKMIKRAQERQYARQGKLNGDLNSSEVQAYIRLSDKAQKKLDEIVERENRSQRVASNIIKLARTLQDIHDIEDCDAVSPMYIDMAVKLSGYKNDTLGFAES